MVLSTWLEVGQATPQLDSVARSLISEPPPTPAPTFSFSGASCQLPPPSLRPQHQRVQPGRGECPAAPPPPLLPSIHWLFTGHRKAWGAGGRKDEPVCPPPPPKRQAGGTEERWASTRRKEAFKQKSGKVASGNQSDRKCVLAPGRLTRCPHYTPHRGGAGPGWAVGSWGVGEHPLRTKNNPVQLALTLTSPPGRYR